MNAFIPRDVPSYTRLVPAGPNQGLTMIPGPFPTSDCFLTDQRSFSDQIDAKSRMHCEAKIDLLGRTPALIQHHVCGLTTECDCEDGEVECADRGHTRNMKFKLNVDQRGDGLTLSLVANAWNPCSPSSRVGGEIDMQAIIKIDLRERTLRFTGVVDSFPAFEAYATINDGAGVTIFTKAPPQGNTVMDLPGNAATKIEGVVLTDPGGGVFKKNETAGMPKFTPLAKRINLLDSVPA